MLVSIFQPLHSKSPSFIGDKRINLSWMEAIKPSQPTTATSAGYVQNSVIITNILLFCLKLHIVLNNLKVFTIRLHTYIHFSNDHTNGSYSSVKYMYDRATVVNWCFFLLITLKCFGTGSTLFHSYKAMLLC